MDTQEDYTTQLRAVRVLAKGSFGVATLMRHEGSGELVVRKSVSLIGLSERARKQAFREVQVLRQCCREVHPFVCRFVTATMKGDELHIYLEYCEGGDLATFIKQRGVEYLSEEAVIDIFAQICLAVKHIHDQRVLHRDIKAQNVFLRADGSVCLGDFGISRLLADTGAMAMTILGTPLSLAPELCEGRAYDNKTDCWALGCLLHQLCALHHPFAAPNMKSLVAKILAGDRRRLPDRYTPKVQELVDALLDRQPSRRPSINEILRIPFIRLKAEAYLTKYGQIKTERKSCVEEPDHADDAKQNLEQIDNLFCFRFKNSTLKLAQRSQSKECRVAPNNNKSKACD
jgi:NIMA (never in mitosis gene a)-related kinase